MHQKILWSPPVTHQNSQNLVPLIDQLSTRLKKLTMRFDNIKLASSLAVEDMLITDIIAKLKLSISVFTLNTGQLHSETCSLIQKVGQHWEIPIEVFQPNTHDVEHYIHEHGAFAFYESLPLRKACCHIRKSEPLNQALATADAWLTGQRQSQSSTRTNLAFEEWDAQHQIAKFNPIFDWSEENVWAYAKQYDLPINALYYQGYPSIGCEPCTRAIKNNEDIRAGRWWWENNDSKECGLHQQAPSHQP